LTVGGGWKNGSKALISPKVCQCPHHLKIGQNKVRVLLCGRGRRLRGPGLEEHSKLTLAREKKDRSSSWEGMEQESA